MGVLPNGCPAVELEDVEEVLLELVGVGDHTAGFGSAAGAGVEQDGFFDAGERVEQAATDRSLPCWWAWRRMRWAIIRASTQ